MAGGLIALASFGAVALIIVAAVLRGWVLTILWGWFIVPMGFPALGLAQAIGLAVLVTMLSHQYVPAKDKDVAHPLIHIVLQPFIALGIGWIVKGFL